MSGRMMLHLRITWKAVAYLGEYLTAQCTPTMPYAVCTVTIDYSVVCMGMRALGMFVSIGFWVQWYVVSPQPQTLFGRACFVQIDKIHAATQLKR